MQVERIRALADLIEQQPHVNPGDITVTSGFCMHMFSHYCGTPACIAGWAASMANSEERGTFSKVRRWLGLSVEQSYELFIAEDGPEYDAITPSHAAAVLRHLADHGVVDWTVGVSR